MTLTLAQINAASQAGFTALLDGTYEHSPWIAREAWASYPILWNAFKRIAAGASPEDKAALFAGTAARVYRMRDVAAAL